MIVVSFLITLDESWIPEHLIYSAVQLSWIYLIGRTKIVKGRLRKFIIKYFMNSTATDLFQQKE